MTRTVSWTGSLTTPRQLHSATLLPNGQVLVVAGLVPHPYDASYTIESGTAELYDPATGQFVSTGSLQTPRYGHEAQLLPNGQVLIVGGFRPDLGAVTTAEIYNPATDTFTEAPGTLALGRDTSPAALLGDGTVWLVGGIGSEVDGPFWGVMLATSDRFDPSTAIDAFGQTINLPATMGAPIVDGDSVIYVQYAVRKIPYPATSIASQLYLLKIRPDGTTTTAELGTSTEANLFPGSLLPDGNGGVLATWTVVKVSAPSDPEP